MLGILKLLDYLVIIHKMTKLKEGMGEGELPSYTVATVMVFATRSYAQSAPCGMYEGRRTYSHRLLDEKTSFQGLKKTNLR